jgi:hypothetical protein
LLNADRSTNSKASPPAAASTKAVERDRDAQRPGPPRNGDRCVIDERTTTIQACDIRRLRNKIVLHLIQVRGLIAPDSRGNDHGSTFTQKSVFSRRRL